MARISGSLRAALLSLVALCVVASAATEGKPMINGGSVKIEGEEAFLSALDSLDARVSNMRPSWPGVARGVYAEVTERFATEGGGGWPGLTEAYAKRKREKFGGRKILSASGALEESLTGRDGPASIYEETDDSVTLGSALVYAGVHQRGAPSKGVPARPIYEETESLEGRILDPVERDLTEYARSLGFAV